MGFTISNYVKSVNDVTKNAVVVDCGNVDSAFKTYVLGSWFYDDSASGGTITKSFYSNLATSSSQIQAKTVGYYTQERWKNLINTYNANK